MFEKLCYLISAKKVREAIVSLSNEPSAWANHRHYQAIHKALPYPMGFSTDGYPTKLHWNKSSRRLLPWESYALRKAFLKWSKTDGIHQGY